MIRCIGGPLAGHTYEFTPGLTSVYSGNPAFC